MLAALVSVAFLGTLSQIKAQPLRNTINDIGLFDGRLVGVDDINLPMYTNLRTFLGINQLPMAQSPGMLAGGIPAAGIGGVLPITGRRLRRCQKDSCERRKMTAQCKYTPILTDMSGQYCRGCDQDVCLGLNLLGNGRNGVLGSNGVIGRNGVLGRNGAIGRNGVIGRNGRNGRRAENKEEKKRLRKLRRRICRSTGVCLGDSQRGVMQGQIKRTLLGGAPGARGILGNQPIMSGGLLGNRPTMNGGLLGNQAVLNGGLLRNRPIMNGGILGNQAVLNGGLLGNQPIMNGGLLGNGPLMNGGLLMNRPPVLGAGLQNVPGNLIGQGLGNTLGQGQVPIFTSG